MAFEAPRFSVDGGGEVSDPEGSWLSDGDVGGLSRSRLRRVDGVLLSLGAVAAAVAEATGEAALWALVAVFAIAQALVALGLLQSERQFASSPRDASVWLLPAAFGVLAGGLLIWSLVSLVPRSATWTIAGGQGPGVATSGVPNEGALLAPGAPFSATAPWHLEVQGTGGQRCDFNLRGVEGTVYGRFVEGTTTMVHVRHSGTFDVQLPHHCRITFRNGFGPVVQLPLQIEPTSQSGASPIFESLNGFTVTMSAGERCTGVVFEAVTGDEIVAALAGSSASTEAQGRFWLETEWFDCSARIASRSAAG